MTDILSSYQVEVTEILEDLRYQWAEQDESTYNTHAFSKIKPTGQNIMFCCPKHAESNPSCGIQLEYPYPWNCFGCGQSGNLASLVAIGLGLSDEFQAERYIVKNYLVTSAKERPAIDIEAILDGTALDRKRSLFEDDVKKFTMKRHTYIVRRGFSDVTLRKYEVGYDELTNSITFPVRTTKGNIRFIKKRFVTRKGFLNESGIEKKDIIYGLHYLNQSPRKIEEIYLNESETDTLSCYESRLPAGAILGRILFRDQVTELIKSGIKVVNLFFDNDMHGVACALKSYELLSKMSAIRVNVVIYPRGQWGIDGIKEMKLKDANDLLKAEMMDAIRLVPFDEFYSSLSREAFDKLEEEKLYVA